jgi:hypothetical protein
MSIDDLESRVLEADGAVDVLATAAERAQQCGDTEYRDTLARLVAAALIDPARLDPVAYYITRLVQLEPIHIRILAALRQSTIEDNEVKGQSTIEDNEVKGQSTIEDNEVKGQSTIEDNEVKEFENEVSEAGRPRSGRQKHRYENGELVVNGEIHIDNARPDKHGFDAGLLEACVKDLGGVGFAEDSGTGLRLTRLGVSAANEIERVRSEIVTSG